MVLRTPAESQTITKGLLSLLVFHISLFSCYTFRYIIKVFQILTPQQFVCLTLLPIPEGA